MTKRVHIVGAGIVGLSVAAHLIRRGVAVTLIDPDPPGGAASWGNAGVISRGSVVPLNTPQVWRALPHYALNRSPSIRFSPSSLPRLTPWLARFLAGATPGRALATARALDGLLDGALDAHRDLMALAGGQDRLRTTGYLKVYRSAGGFRASAFERGVYDTLGLDHQILLPDELRALEPDLAPVFHRGILVPGSASVDDPGAVTGLYADWVLRAGADLVRAAVRGLRPTAKGYGIEVQGGPPIPAETVVMAAGAWSAPLLAGVGVGVPLAAERGYHQRFGFVGNARLGRPFHDVEGHYVMTGMAEGIQVSTGVELAPVDAPSTPRQLARVLPAAREAFPFAEPVAEVWRGARPSLPDGRPVIGAVPKRPGLWAAFGHGHIGFSAGPVTGRLLADAIVTGTASPVLAPFDPARVVKVRG